MYEEIQYETADGIATITIDRPDALNAFTERTIEELNDAIEEFREDDGIYACLLTGADGGFCAGADVKSMPDWSDMTKEEYGDFLSNVQNVVRQLRKTPKPTIAAVGGPAIGAGCDFALACDIRFVGPNALLREGFVKVGLVPGDGGAWLLPRLIGEAQARRYLLTGEDISPDTAVDLGLAVEKVSEPVEESRKFAEQLLELPATAVKRTNQLIDPDQTFDEYCEQAIDYQWECVNDPEHKEAITAFREKRAPDFDRDYQ